MCVGLALNMSTSVSDNTSYSVVDVLLQVQPTRREDLSAFTTQSPHTVLG